MRSHRSRSISCTHPRHSRLRSHPHFPSEPRQRIAVASYPFREFIAGPEHKQGNPTIELKDFAAHVVGKFNVNKIEPWTGHFPATDAKYLEHSGLRLKRQAPPSQTSPSTVNTVRTPPNVGA